MKEIKEIIINQAAIDSKVQAREYVIKGDPGAVFSITVTNEDNHYYNFPENTIIQNSETESLPAPAFSATTNRLNPVTIDSSGVYSNTVTFPTVTDDDTYIFTIYPEMHYDTKLSDFMGIGSYIFARINQLVNTTITFAHLSANEDAGDERYGTYASSYTVSGGDTRVGDVSSKTISISWALSLSSDAMEIAKQPDQNDFYFTTARSTKTSGTGTDLEITDISGLSVGMEVIGTGIAGGATISTITAINKGYYNAGKSTTVFPFYDVAKIVDSSDPNNPTLVDYPGGTITLAATNNTFVAGRSLTFKGYGPVMSKVFNNTNFSISNFKVELSDVLTTVNDTDATGAASLTVFDVASVNGIKDDVSTVIGIGISDASTTTVTNISSNTLTVNTAFKPENGQALQFAGASRTGTITGDVTVSSFGSDNISLVFELDKILTIE
tara:strand:+ start:2770 stop:4089 length:1320 start_codon:yes stop_codon:yes gene_type:complete